MTSTAGQIAQDQVGSLAPKQKGDHRDPVVSMIFWHLSIVKHGELPSGALLIRRSRGHGDLVLFGSDVEASALSPDAVDG